MSMDARIREATLSDLGEIYAIWRDGSAESLGSELPAGVDYEPVFKRRIEEQDEDFKLFVAEDDSGLLGWQGLAPFRSNPATRRLMAESSTYVRAGNLGVGRALIAHALSHADRSKLQYVVAFVARSNERTLRSALKAGFVHVGDLPMMNKEPFGPALAYIVYPAKRG